MQNRAPDYSNAEEATAYAISLLPNITDIDIYQRYLGAIRCIREECKHDTRNALLERIREAPVRPYNPRFSHNPAMHTTPSQQSSANSASPVPEQKRNNGP